MLVIRLREGCRPRTLLIALLMLGLVVAAWSLPASDVAAAAADVALAETPVLDAAGDEASDDPFHVSGAGLAIAVIIPGIFLVATGATVAWAISNRARPEDDEDDA